MIEEHYRRYYDHKCVYYRQYDPFLKLEDKTYLKYQRYNEDEYSGGNERQPVEYFDRSYFEAIRDDWNAVEDIFFNMSRGVMDNYADDRGLTKAIRTSFGFLFNGEDITESLAKAEATKDTLYKALGALHAKEQEEQEKLKGGKLMVGNNIINFAKRKE